MSSGVWDLWSDSCKTGVLRVFGVGHMEDSERGRREKREWRGWDVERWVRRSQHRVSDPSYTPFCLERSLLSSSPLPGSSLPRTPTVHCLVLIVGTHSVRVGDGHVVVSRGLHDQAFRFYYLVFVLNRKGTIRRSQGDHKGIIKRPLAVRSQSTRIGPTSL